MMNYLLKRKEICDEWFKLSWEHNVQGDIVRQYNFIPTCNKKSYLHREKRYKKNLRNYRVNSVAQ